MKPTSLQVILKVSERCNLSCTYCYYFFAGDESYSKRPPVIKEDTVVNIARFLEKGAADLEIGEISIAFHGGEPLLVKPQRLRDYCEIFLREIKSASLQFVIQTNAVLVNDEWIEIFKQYKIQVGISLDGNELENDKFRISNNGEGTYKKVVAGLKKTQEAFVGDYLGLRGGTISVVNPYYDYKKIFKHIHVELGVDELSFLLPDCQHDSGLPHGSTAVDYGKILCDIFDAWIETGCRARVRQFSDLLRNLQQISSSSLKAMPVDGKLTQIIVIQSDGDISIDDTYMVALEWRSSYETPNVKTEEMKVYLNRPVIKEIDNLNMTLPSECKSCCWINLCKGGDLENRYSKKNGFDNPSIFCAGLKQYYGHVVNYLINNGYPREKIEEYLLSEERTKILFKNHSELVEL